VGYTKQIDPGEDDEDKEDEEQSQQQVTGGAVDQLLMIIEVLHQPDVPLGMSIAGGSRAPDAEVFPTYVHLALSRQSQLIDCFELRNHYHQDFIRGSLQVKSPSIHLFYMYMFVSDIVYHSDYLFICLLGYVGIRACVYYYIYLSARASIIISTSPLA